MDFDWAYTYSLLWDTDFWRACWTVAQLSISSWLIAGAIGFGLALGKQSNRVVINWPVRIYIWFFRSLPLLVLLVFVYNLPQVFPASRLVLSSPFYAGLIALVLSETAYMAEIHRGGILSVHKGQYEAGKALGIGYTGIQRLIVIPQAIRIALPTLSNEFVTIVKLTSLVSVISLTEILLVGQRLYTQNFLIFETMLAVAFYYVLVVTLFDKVLIRLESFLDVSKRKPRPFKLSDTERHEIEALRESEAAAIAQGRQQARATPVLQVRGINKHYASHHALQDIDLTVNQGDVISIIGPSGSGKTSLIRALNGLETIDTGTVLVNGRHFLGEHTDQREKTDADQILDIGMVFQSFNLFPHKTALENVLLAPGYHRRGSAKARRTLALSQLYKVGLIEHVNKYPHQLSGGQQQRVAIARALAMKPSIMLFDEPTSALDPELVSEVLKVLEQLASEGMTMLIVTHEMQFAFSVSNRVVFMKDGAIIYDSTPETLRNTSDPRVKDFLHQVTR